MSSRYDVTIKIPNWSLFNDQLQALVYVIEVFRDTLAKDKPIRIHIRDIDILIDLVPEASK